MGNGMMNTTEASAHLAGLLAKASPGPWRFDGPVWNQIIWTDNENRVCFMAHSNGLDDDRDIATAALIAMAPDLAADVLRLSALITEARAILTHPEPGSIEAQQMIAAFMEATK